MKKYGKDEKRKPKKKAGKTVLIIVCVLLVLLSGVGVAGGSGIAVGSQSGFSPQIVPQVELQSMQVVQINSQVVSVHP